MKPPKVLFITGIVDTLLALASLVVSIVVIYTSISSIMEIRSKKVELTKIDHHQLHKLEFEFSPLRRLYGYDRMRRTRQIIIPRVEPFFIPKFDDLELPVEAPPTESDPVEAPPVEETPPVEPIANLDSPVLSCVRCHHDKSGTLPDAHEIIVPLQNRIMRP